MNLNNLEEMKHKRNVNKQVNVMCESFDKNLCFCIHVYFSNNDNKQKEYFRIWLLLWGVV